MILILNHLVYSDFDFKSFYDILLCHEAKSIINHLVYLYIDSPLDLVSLDYKLIKSEERNLYTFPFGLSCLLVIMAIFIK